MAKCNLILSKLNQLLIFLLFLRSIKGTAPYEPLTSNSTEPTSKPQLNPNDDLTAIKNGGKTVSYGFSQPAPFNSSGNSSAPRRFVIVYSVESINRMVTNYIGRVTTNDPLNEDYYSRKRIGDNVWFNIERVAPFKMFVGWMANTSRITDRFDPDQDKSLINNYIQVPEVRCAPETIFQLSNEVIMSDDVVRRVQLDPKISEWFTNNEDTPPEQMCNRFRGLQCSPSRSVCECENERMHYVSYVRSSLEQNVMYRDGCYVKAWRSCSHLSIDPSVESEYKSYHAHPDNMKQFLIRLATPMPKMARCERGSYCVDLILNKKKPICWCSSRQYSKQCFNTTVPMLERFLSIRKSFHQMMIVEKDRTTKCTADDKLNDYLQQIEVLSENPEVNFHQILTLMKEVLISRSKGTRFCDFRKGMACDPSKKTCSYKKGCGPGRVLEIQSNNRRVCKVNNGYPCPTLDLQCVRGAECKDFGKGKHCHCTPDRFGDLCRYYMPTFFGTLLQSRISGFTGYHFVNMQEVVNLVLIPLERLMTLGYGEKCNPHMDMYAMNIIKYLGNVRHVVLDKMDGVLAAIQALVGKNEPLCDYTSFLGCASITGQCEPMIPDVIDYVSHMTPERFVRGADGKVEQGKVVLTLRDKARCTGPGNYTNVPAIYEDVIHVQCMPHHTCRSMSGQSLGQQQLNLRFCLCPDGYQGNGCEEKEAEKVVRIDVYELPAPVVVARKNNKGRHQHRGVVGR